MPLQQTAERRQRVDPDWAWEPYRPDPQRPWNLRMAGHLLRRAGFGGDWGQLQRALTDGPQKTIDRLFHPDAEAFSSRHDDQEAAALSGDSGSVDDLGQWWLRRMILTPDPLREKITLFLHNHLAINGAQVGSARLLQVHLQLLRSHGLQFDRLLDSLCRDPAALLAARCPQNVKNHVDDRFARVLLEQFTLGPGVCSAAEVREVARALTGSIVLRKKYLFEPSERDAGSKQFLGQSGDFQLADVLRIVLSRLETSRRLVRGLYRWLVSEGEEPEPSLLQPLSQGFLDDYDLGRLAERVLRSNLFFSTTAYRQRVKSPIEFAVGIVRALESLVPMPALANDLAELGQRLGQPPTSAGWEGGAAWLNPVTLSARQNLALALVTDGGRYGSHTDPAGLAVRHDFSTPSAAADFFLDLFLQGDVSAEAAKVVRNAATARGNARQVVHFILALPEYQLA